MCRGSRTTQLHSSVNNLDSIFKPIKQSRLNYSRNDRSLGLSFRVEYAVPSAFLKQDKWFLELCSRKAKKVYNLKFYKKSTLSCFHSLICIIFVWKRMLLEILICLDIFRARINISRYTNTKRYHMEHGIT